MKKIILSFLAAIIVLTSYASPQDNIPGLTFCKSLLNRSIEGTAIGYTKNNQLVSDHIQVITGNQLDSCGYFGSVYFCNITGGTITVTSANRPVLKFANVQVPCGNGHDPNYAPPGGMYLQITGQNDNQFLDLLLTANGSGHGTLVRSYSSYLSRNNQTSTETDLFTDASFYW